MSRLSSDEQQARDHPHRIDWGFENTVFIATRPGAPSQPLLPIRAAAASAEHHADDKACDIHRDQNMLQ
jgi:hypothetical protein